MEVFDTPDPAVNCCGMPTKSPNHPASGDQQKEAVEGCAEGCPMGRPLVVSHGTVRDIGTAGRMGHLGQSGHSFAFLQFPMHCGSRHSRPVADFSNR
jgi:hypothetical protein